MNITSRRADIGIFRALVKFTEHDYTKSLEILLNERFQAESSNALIDPMTRLDFDYTEAVLHFAVGDSKSALQVMENSIEFSKQKQVFYRIDHIYSLAAAYAMMKKDDQEYAYYLKKLTQYGEFSEDKGVIFATKFSKIHYLNSFNNSYKEALYLLNQLVKDSKINKVYQPHLNLEKGKSLFGLTDFDKALGFLEKVTIADYIHHPFDLSIFYEKDAYIALCHMNLKNPEKALKHAKIAFDNISGMPHTPYKDFITETYKKIHERQ